METQRSPLLNWPYYYQLNSHGKNMEELKNAFICTTLELETTRLAAQEEIRKREEQLTHLQESLNKAITERNEAQENCKALLLEKLLLQQQQQQQQQQPQQKVVVHSGSSSSNIEDEPTTCTKKVIISNNNNANNVGNFSSSDCDESIISSPRSPQQQQQLTALPESAMKLLPPKEELPEKGNLLQAVIKAGPLLQTLLLAGPLPQWRHPPPPLENFDIPPVTISPSSAVIHHYQSEVIANHHDYQQDDVLINVTNHGFNDCGSVNRKRVFEYDESSCEANKYQRVLH